MTEVANRSIMESNQALQAALELSMLNLNNTTYSTASPDPPFGLFEDQEEESVSVDSKGKSQNITQCVSVPSSEHVAEIVGRQGCKIKALRAKTNTYIKTPVRGEEPVFIITGRPEDVAFARREILSAADHFTQIRASRKASLGGQTPDTFGSPPSPDDANKVTILVRVPYRVVGLVVGPKGATVKRIQQVTNTYIVTPSRDKDPAFEVRGSPENVEKAKKEIESYIALRTGGSVSDVPGSPPEPSNNNHPLLSPPTSFLASCPPSSVPANQFRRRIESTKVTSLELAQSRPCDPDQQRRMSPLSHAVFSNGPEENIYVPMSAPATTHEQAFDFSSFQEPLLGMRYRPLEVDMMKDSIFTPVPPQPSSPTYSWDSNSSEGLAINSPKQSTLGTRSVSCSVCRDKDVVAALVPCGHNLFCMSCARYIARFVGNCPVCSTPVENILRIHTR